MDSHGLVGSEVGVARDLLDTEGPALAVRRVWRVNDMVDLLLANS